MVLAAMFKAPIAVITPTYLWCTHLTDMTTVPIVLAHNRQGKWFATCTLY